MWETAFIERYARLSDDLCIYSDARERKLSLDEEKLTSCKPSGFPPLPDIARLHAMMENQSGNQKARTRFLPWIRWERETVPSSYCIAESACWPIAIAIRYSEIKTESGDRLRQIAQTSVFVLVGMCFLWKGEHLLPGENCIPPLPRSKISPNGLSRG
jgi:hypothetical protein